MKKYLWALLLIPFLFVITACSDDEGTFSIDQVKIDAQIAEDGIIHVRELYTYTFDGTFNGMTRSLKSDVKNFRAFLAEDEDPTVSTKGLKALKVEEDEDDEVLKIHTPSNNETKQVLYSYDIHGSVKKYRDVAELTYAFFDEANETDLHQVEIAIHPPAKAVTDEINFFLHDDETGTLQATNDAVLYTNPLLKAGDSSTIRLLFPAEQVATMKLDRDKAMKEKILAEEKDLAERRANLEMNMEKVLPVIWFMLIGSLVAATVLFIKNPNRYPNEKSEDELLRLLEKTDPLFVKYISDRHIDSRGYLIDQKSFIAGLFSLKQRGIVTLQEVPAVQTEGETTFRFTWKKSVNGGDLDMADNFLYSWLFTEKDRHGEYFLLESLIAQEDDSDEVKEEKAEHFQENFTQWSGLVQARDGYSGLRNRNRSYSIIATLLVIASYGLFYYFSKIDTLSALEQLIVPLVIGVFAIIGIVFSRNKWVVSFFFPITIIATLICFSITSSVLLYIAFLTLAFLILLFIPSHYWREDIKQLKQAIKVAKKLFNNGHYPIGADPAIVERHLEYAIILNKGEAYGEQCGKTDIPTKFAASYPLLSNPAQFSYDNIMLYTVSVSSNSSSSSTTTSSTGGGGAGAF